MHDRIGQRLENDISSSEIFINKAGESLDSFFEQYQVAKNSDTRLDLLKEHIQDKVNDDLDELIQRYQDTKNLLNYGSKTVTAIPIIRLVAEMLMNVNSQNYLNEISFNHLAGHFIEIGVVAVILVTMTSYLGGKISNIEDMLNERLDMESWLIERSKKKAARLEDRLKADLTINVEDARYQEDEI